MCPAEKSEDFQEETARAADKAQQCRSKSCQGFWDVKHSWVSSTTTTGILVLCSEMSTSSSLPPRLQLALAVLQRETSFALAVLLQSSLTPSPPGGNMCCGLGNILMVELHLQQSHPSPTLCFWLSDSAAGGGGRAGERQSSDTALGSAGPQISGILFIPLGTVPAQIGPSLFHPG